MFIENRFKNIFTSGYPNPAAYALTTKMAKTPENVKDFLVELGVKLKPLGKREIKKLLKLKEEESMKFGFGFDGRIGPSDIR